MYFFLKKPYFFIKKLIQLNTGCHRVDSAPSFLYSIKQIVNLKIYTHATNNGRKNRHSRSSNYA